MITCDLCGKAKDCLQKEIEGKEYDICPECWNPLAQKLKGKGRPNQTGSNTVTTTYSYDALHRLTQKSYSDGITPTANYGYDQQAPWGWNLSNYIGRLTSESTSSGTATLFNYDPMGRVINYGQCNPLNCTGPNPAFHVYNTYDLAGNISTFTDSVGETYTQTISGAGRVTQLNSNWVDFQHPAVWLTRGRALWSGNQRLCLENSRMSLWNGSSRSFGQSLTYATKVR